MTDELTLQNMQAALDLTTNKVMGNCDYCCPPSPVQVWSRLDTTTNRPVNACVRCLKHSKPIPQPKPTPQPTARPMRKLW